MAAITYLDLIRSTEARIGIKMLNPEYEVTAMLFDFDRLTPLEMQQKFSGSAAGFFKILKSLEAKDVITATPNPLDGRSKLYRLSDRVRSVMASQWSRYNEGGREKLYAADDPGEAIHKYTETVTQKLRVKQFTSEYQILLYLGASPGLTNVKCHDLVDVSEAKFNMSLASLKNAGLIVFERDPADKRAKLYYLSEHIKDLFDEMNKSIFDWLSSKSEWMEEAQREG